MSIPSDKPSVAIVVVNWERPEDTLACLASIQAQNQAGLQVILVDNGSKDDSVEQIAKAYPQVQLLQLPENLGFSQGYNHGIAAALQSGAPWIFLLNNDTTLETGAISHLISGTVDMGVPKILYHSQPDTIWAAGCRWRPFPPSVVMLGLDQPDGPHYNQPRRLEYATGCALMLSRAALEQVGGFDPQYVSYMEDYDFCYRLRQAGYQIDYIPQARIYHKVSQTLGVLSPQRWQHLGRNTVLFYRKHKRFSSLTLWLYLTWFILRETLKGNARLLPHFMRGVSSGLELNKQHAN